MCASVENGNPLFWDEDVADEHHRRAHRPAHHALGVVPAPSLGARTHDAPHLPLQIHFDLKERLGLPEAVMTDNTIVFHEPVRPGDVLTTRQILRSVSDEKTTKLGTGRFWVIDVEYTQPERRQLVGVESYTGFGYRRAEAGTAVASDGRERPRPRVRRRGRGRPPARAAPTTSPPPRSCSAPWPARDWRPMHHDKDFAVERNGTRDIFLNTPNQAAWFERYITDWTGPHGRLGRMTFRMLDSVFPGDTMVFAGVVDEVTVDDAGCGWVGLDITLSVDGDVKTHVHGPGGRARGRRRQPVAPTGARCTWKP